MTEEIQNNVKKFAQEVIRLEKKYDCFDETDKTLDEITSMWITNYFENYFLEEHYPSIIYCGPEKYAQYYLHIRGVIPEFEVTMWD